MSVTFMLTKMALNVCLPAIPSFHYPKENTDSRPHVRTNSGKISDLQFQVLNYKTRNLFRCHSLRYSSFEDSVMYLCLYPSPSRQNLFFFLKEPVSSTYSFLQNPASSSLPWLFKASYIYFFHYILTIRTPTPIPSIWDLLTSFNVPHQLLFQFLLPLKLSHAILPPPPSHFFVPRYKITCSIL